MIYLIDQIPGSGKTSAAINYIKQNTDKRFVYVTPYLTEVERIKKECSFTDPVNYTEFTPKLVDFKYLLAHEQNIVTTHALFSYFDDEIIDIIKAYNYVLFMDETYNVIENFRMTPYDAETLFERYADIVDGKLIWKEGAVATKRFEDVMTLCNNSCLYGYNSTSFIQMFPVKVFEAFKDIYLMTYMFSAQLQRYYFDYYKLNYTNLYVKGSNYEFTTEKQEEDKSCRKLINIFEDSKLNSIGEDKYALSKEWYKRRAKENDPLFVQMRKNLENFFQKKPVLYNEETGLYETSSSSNNIWTTFSDYKRFLSGRGYTKGFVPLNMRATNEYRNRTVVAYTVNRFMNPTIYNFLNSSGFKPDQEAYALSELLQFIWRSGVRDGKQIVLYLPSSRMRRILKDWIDNS